MNYSHGKHKHLLHDVWSQMKYRCANKNCKAYIYYGGRGITVCDEWKEFINFYSWAIKNGWEEGLQIDRINNNLGYYPNNCRLVTAAENLVNRGPCRPYKRNKHRDLPQGIEKSLNKWRARFTRDGKRVTVGSFETIEEAVRCREKAIASL